MVATQYLWRPYIGRSGKRHNLHVIPRLSMQAGVVCALHHSAVMWQFVDFGL